MENDQNLFRELCFYNNIEDARLISRLVELFSERIPNQVSGAIRYYLGRYSKGDWFDLDLNAHGTLNLQGCSWNGSNAELPLGVFKIENNQIQN